LPFRASVVITDALKRNRLAAIGGSDPSTLAKQRNCSSEARELLSKIWFKEGFDTHHVKQAKVLLEQWP
jgi:hypothetical protein